MLSRLSSVQQLNVKIASFSAVIQIGDSTFVNSFSRALAVQREEEIFFGTEGSYNAYSIFSEEIPFTPIKENILMYRHNLNPVIKVSSIDLIGVTAASVLHIGNTCHVQLEARVKHIRQLKKDAEKLL